MMRPRILVAGIGNIFMGDDGFGSEVARRLAARELPDEVRVVDFGIRGFDLAFALLDGYEVTIFVDATPRGGEPGTLYTIEPDLADLDRLDAEHMMVEAHGMDPMRALWMAKSMGGEFKRILLVGCEPETLGPEEGQMGLSEKAEAAAAEAVSLIESLVTGILECDYECGRREWYSKRRSLIMKFPELFTRKKKSNHTIWKVIGGTALALIAAGVILNIPDVKRYIKISTM